MKNSICVILAGCLWGIISIFVNVLTDLGLGSLECVAVRVTVAAVILFFYILITDKSKFKIELKDIIVFVGTGMCSIVFFSYCYFEAIEVIGGASIPALLLYTAPLFVMILSAVFFKEKITKKKIIALVITFIGLGFVTGAFTKGERLSIKALMLGLGSGFGYALYSIFGKSVAHKYHAITITFYTFAIASAGAIPISGVLGNIKLVLNFEGIIAIVGLAFLSTALPFLLYTKGLQGIEAAKAAILATVEPFVAAVVGIALFHETFDIPKIVGMIMIVFSIIFLNIQKTGKQEYRDEKG